MKKYLILFLILAFLHMGCHASASEGDAATSGEWVEIPAGSKPAYMGIHGGTMPVSLLVSQDGASLYTFVGQTGNDFLEVLRKSWLPLPSFGNATRKETWTARLPEMGLFAGNSTASMPVIPVKTDIFTEADWIAQLQPFGLSSHPLSIEGQAAFPVETFSGKRYRLFTVPDFFQPRQARR